MAPKERERRLHEYTLPPAILTIASKHGELSPSDNALVLSTIATYETSITSLQQRITTLKESSDADLRKELRQEIALTQARIPVCRSFLAPIRRVPFEILGEIFQFFVASSPSSSPSVQGRGQQGSAIDERSKLEWRAGTLCLVCKSWNAVASATPALWSLITINLDVPPTVLTRTVQSTRIAALLARMDHAGSHPWTLRINGPAMSFFTENEKRNWNLYAETVDTSSKASSSGTENDVLPRLLNRPPSLHMARLTISASQTDFDISSVTFPNVTSLACVDDWDQSPSLLLNHLPALPALTHAVLDTAFPASLPGQIPWAQLTHLYVGGNVTAPQWKVLLKHCTSLEKGLFYLAIEYEDDEPYPAFPEPPGTIVLPHLTDLTFLNTSPFEAQHTTSYQNLELPSLTRLRVFTECREPHMHVPPPLVHHLTHFTMVQVHWTTGPEVTAILALMPNLTELYVSVTVESGFLFDWLTLGHCDDSDSSSERPESSEGKGKGKRKWKWNLPKLKALGMQIQVESPRLAKENGEDPDEYEANDNGIPRIDKFPLHRDKIADLVASRTSLGTGASTRLERFILRIVTRMDSTIPSDTIWASTLRPTITQVLKPFEESSGLKIHVWDDWTAEKSGERYWTGVAPAPNGKEERLKHWDEGFAKFVDECKDYSLYSF